MSKQTTTAKAVKQGKTDSKADTAKAVKATKPADKSVDTKQTETQVSQDALKEQAQKDAKATESQKDSTGAAKDGTFAKAYELEDQRLKDAQKDSNEGEKITDEDAVKTDGTQNVNAEKSLPTTEAQKSVPEEVRTGEVEQPHLNKTTEERLGLANPDDRIAEELREAKITATTPATQPEDEGKKSEGSSEAPAKDERTDDITFPDGAMKAQERKDAQTAYDFHIEEMKKNYAEAGRALDAMERLAPKQ